MIHHDRHRGFVMVTALLALALVAVAIVALATATSFDGHHTLQQSQTAQLEQMLLAGAADAGEHLKSAAPTAGASWAVEMPADLASEGATLRTSVASLQSDETKLLVTARLGDQSAEQTLAFKRGQAHLQLAHDHTCVKGREMKANLHRKLEREKDGMFRYF